jgi:hypothetical protein
VLVCGWLDHERKTPQKQIYHTAASKDKKIFLIEVVKFRDSGDRAE